MVATAVVSTRLYSSALIEPVDRPMRANTRQTDARQHKGEFANLEETQAHGNGNDIAIVEQAGDGGKNSDLAHGHQKNQQGHHPKMIHQKTGIQQHTHRGEEKQAKHVAQWNDIAERLVTIVRLSEHHASDKGAKGKGQPNQIGGVANTQANGNHGQ